MRKQVTSAICILFSSITHGQGVSNLWLMGYDTLLHVQTGRIRIDFSSGIPDISWTVRPMSMAKANALISNTSGDLLFYTNGVYIANANDDTMLNGEDLNPSTYTSQYQEDGLYIAQADFVIPVPGDSNKYYLFHSTIDDGCVSCITYYLYYSIIDMSLDNGNGAVVSKNNILLSNSLVPGMITGCKHANGRDWWIICHQYNSNQFYKFLISPYGISAPFIQSIGSTRIANGQTVFSPNGKSLAYYDFNDDLDIMDFDRCTGDFSNLNHIPINDGAFATGVAYSENSEVLYASSMNYVYQFDLTALNIPASQLTVAVWDSFYSPDPPFASTFYLSQIAPDGKIYIICSNSTVDIHVINNPDTLGMACDVCQHCIHLPTYNAFTIPNYPNYFLGIDSTSAICDSLNSSGSILPCQNFGISIFPNPARDKLYLHFPDRNLKTITVSLQDLIGKQIFRQSKEVGEYLELNISDLVSSVYFLEISSFGFSTTKRFIKN
jgi:hypothetical protein